MAAPWQKCPDLEKHISNHCLNACGRVTFIVFSAPKHLWQATESAEVEQPLARAGMIGFGFDLVSYLKQPLLQIFRWISRGYPEQIFKLLGISAILFLISLAREREIVTQTVMLNITPLLCGGNGNADLLIFMDTIRHKMLRTGQQLPFQSQKQSQPCIMRPARGHKLEFILPNPAKGKSHPGDNVSPKQLLYRVTGTQPHLIYGKEAKTRPEIS